MGASANSAVVWRVAEEVEVSALATFFGVTYVTASGFLGGSITADKVRTMIRDRLLVFPRFRSKVAFDSSQRFLSAISFQELPLGDIDLEYHVQEAGRGKSWGAPELDAFISQIYSQDMDHEKPLWQFYVINQMADGSDMLMAVIDHAIGDGTTMVEVRTCRTLPCPASNCPRALAQR